MNCKFTIQILYNTIFTKTLNSGITDRLFVSQSIGFKTQILQMKGMI